MSKARTVAAVPGLVVQDVLVSIAVDHNHLLLLLLLRACERRTSTGSKPVGVARGTMHPGAGLGGLSGAL